MTTPTITDYYSDEKLTEQAADGMDGTARRARLLLTVEPDMRSILDQEARYQMNVRGAGWRPSSMLNEVINQWEQHHRLDSPTAAAMQAELVR